MTEQPRDIQSFLVTWQGIYLMIRYEPAFLNMNGPYAHAHLQIESLQPKRAPLPVTETGYRSHFTHAANVEEQGGPVAYALAWLDEAASTSAWRHQTDAARQLSLFDD